MSSKQGRHRLLDLEQFVKFQAKSIIVNAHNANFLCSNMCVRNYRQCEDKANVAIALDFVLLDKALEKSIF